MDIAEKLPGMADEDLKTLLENARRLRRSGTPKQQAQAVALTPLVEAEIAVRKPPSTKPPKAKTRAAKTAAP